MFTSPETMKPLSIVMKSRWLGVVFPRTDQLPRELPGPETVFPPANAGVEAAAIAMNETPARADANFFWRIMFFGSCNCVFQ